MAVQTVSFYTLGCKLNFSETSTIARQLDEHGFQKVNFEQGADVYVINTCSVTDNADKKCRKVVKEALKFNPSAFVAIVGCYAQLKPQEIAGIPGVDVVLGAAEKFNLIAHLSDLTKRSRGEVHNTRIKEVSTYQSAYSVGDRTRSFLKVQDGCDYFCSFCTIPLARGKSRSDTVANVIKQAEEIVAKGVKEIVLTGVNIGDFGVNTGETFYDLLKGLEQVEGINRLRISSIEPNLLTNEIMELASVSKQIVPHFHIPLQSGSDKLLKLMRRKYLRELYANRVATIKKLMPHACIGVDVIIGFPGETNEDFLDTYTFLNELDVSYLHVFTYSERVNTTAYKMEDVVPMNERNERSKMLHILSDKKRRFFYEQHLGKTFNVLFEAEQDGSFMHGFTDNYIKVKTTYEPLLVNEVTEVELVQITDDGTVLCNVPVVH
ncbi:MAG: tRNA (N(6)-L-threonylcarbamoyladenosine(37)-C(2))-methylthiotransferase MtaB [Bacteroidia bacterium]|nr:tRNA (N(6)-L-threonylcarbamoyladenosine(37)-C(2))-methylthiotransferase MtaB [Bacteroidia bacterium]MBP7262394.1 tRNA (N(6)-L-threonylcarbamoyladenosine(37)-C(2))-methylthiotransferase MtaB [Bacteroidia bacterium]MBP9179263.1 tRNA (N(6)-L-threonylcarbamoyladenosine(37)-C(2))-methylthiotransferase MtaB [Bacteroidia bacterium]MBP9724315.1 tRNA (N(6)-L-threonylcarbamoyladenosine(37)-C(2))-methylthiotransferase MtaB [Bacteroidia bacterium]